MAGSPAMEDELDTAEAARRLVAPRATKRVALARVIAVGLGLGAAVGVLGPAARRSRTTTSLEILDDQIDDAMNVACVSDDEMNFGTKLQELAGYRTAAYPSGGAILTDRGQYPAFHGTPYDYDEMVAGILAGYDDALAACAADVTTCQGSIFVDPPVCSLAAPVVDGEPWPQVSCTEDCVQDLFFAADGGKWSDCDDPVAAAMFKNPELFKSCFVTGSECHTCIDGCLAMDEVPLHTGCGDNTIWDDGFVFP